MAKNIDFMGATFPDVPSIRLPQHEGGLVSFDDTSDGNIQPADVTQGKIGYAQGQRVVGTAVTPSGSQTYTQNGTYDVTALAEAVINVAGGGGASWKLLASKTYTFTQEPPTSTTQIDSFQLDPNEIYVGDRLIYSISRRKNFSGQASCYVGCDWVFANINLYQHTTSPLTLADRGGRMYYTDDSGTLKRMFSGANNSSGVNVATISADGTVTVGVRYIQSLGSLVGEYSLDVYSLEWPDNLAPFQTT